MDMMVGKDHWSTSEHLSNKNTRCVLLCFRLRKCTLFSQRIKNNMPRVQTRFFGRIFHYAYRIFQSVGWSFNRDKGTHHRKNNFKWENKVWQTDMATNCRAKDTRKGWYQKIKGLSNGTGSDNLHLLTKEAELVLILMIKMSNA